MQDNIPQVWHVNRATPVPLYKQLADNIKWSIHLGNVGTGWKLPSVRALAKELDVSIDTVRSAYKILEEEGLAVARPHHGTEVMAPENKKNLLSDIFAGEEENLSAIVSRCFAKGMTQDQLKDMFLKVLEEESSTQSAPRILFVECNEEDGRRFREQLSSVLDIRVDIIMVDKLEELCRQPSSAQKRYKAIVTTYFHYALVMQQVQSLKLPVYGVVTEMSGAALQSIRHFQPGAKIGVILRPSHSVNYLMSLITAVRDDLEIRKAILGNDEELDQVIRWGDAFVVTHPCEKEVSIRRPDAEVLFFCDSINAQSIGILRENLNYLLQE